MFQMASLAESVNSGDAQTARALALLQLIDRGVCTPTPTKQVDNGVCTPTTPTEQTYGPLLAAFKHFNHGLFNGALPDCLIILHRKAGAYGYFSPGKFAAINGDALVDEVALNPAYFRASPPKDVLSTLVHEMAHAWQHHFGKPPRAGYHNAERAAVMRGIGLQPFSNSDPVKEIGYSVDHRIVDGGPFDLSYKAFEATGQTLHWGDAPHSSDDKKRDPKRETYVCPGCGLKALCVPKKEIWCGACDLVMVARHKGETADIDNAGAVSDSIGAGEL